MKKTARWLWMGMIVCLTLGLGGCKSAPQGGEEPLIPPLPEKIEKWKDGVPLLDVYVLEEEKVETMTLEEYLCGVVAGEMNASWPQEALKAQAILARTFVLRFMTEKESKYEGADVSTDIEEAQAYDLSAVNEKIRTAVESTRGMALSYEGEFPYAWFHAHSGGQTAGAVEGLNWKAEEPGYTLQAKGHEEDEAPWEASFTQEEVRVAAEECGVQEKTAETVALGEKGPSGRTTTLLINGNSVSAADFRVAVGSEKMKSTFLTSLRWEDGVLYLQGRGYGHGVGMSQWGARALALQGYDAQQIIDSYFRNITVVKIY